MAEVLVDSEGGHHNVSKDAEHNKKNQENGDNKNDNPEVLPVMLQ